MTLFKRLNAALMILLLMQAGNSLPAVSLAGFLLFAPANRSNEERQEECPQHAPVTALRSESRGNARTCNFLSRMLAESQHWAADSRISAASMREFSLLQIFLERANLNGCGGPLRC